MPKCSLFSLVSFSAWCRELSPGLRLSFHGKGKARDKPVSASQANLFAVQNAFVALKAGLELVGKSWAALLYCLHSRGILSAQLVILHASARDRPPVWLLSYSIEAQPLLLFSSIKQASNDALPRVTLGLHIADKHVTPPFRDYRWNCWSASSTALSSLWLSVLRQYQLDSRVAADNLLSLFRAPIWNLFASDASPEMSRDTLLGLILWLALSLWTAGAGNGNVAMPNAHSFGHRSALG